MRTLFTFLKVVLGFVVAAFLFVAAVAAYNSFDEDLTPEAMAANAPRPAGKVEDQNGYIAFIGIGAPKGEDQMAWGRTAAHAYVAQAQPGFTRTPAWQKAINATLVALNTASQWCDELECLPIARERSAELASLAHFFA